MGRTRKTRSNNSLDDLSKSSGSIELLANYSEKEVQEMINQKKEGISPPPNSPIQTCSNSASTTQPQESVTGTQPQGSIEGIHLKTEDVVNNEEEESTKTSEHVTSSAGGPRIRRTTSSSTGQWSLTRRGPVAENLRQVKTRADVEEAIRIAIDQQTRRVHVDTVHIRGYANGIKFDPRGNRYGMFQWGNVRLPETITIRYMKNWMETVNHDEASIGWLSAQKGILIDICPLKPGLPMIHIIPPPTFWKNMGGRLIEKEVSRGSYLNADNKVMLKFKWGVYTVPSHVTIRYMRDDTHPIIPMETPHWVTAQHGGVVQAGPPARITTMRCEVCRSMGHDNRHCPHPQELIGIAEKEFLSETVTFALPSPCHSCVPLGHTKHHPCGIPRSRDVFNPARLTVSQEVHDKLREWSRKCDFCISEGRTVCWHCHTCGDGTQNCTNPAHIMSGDMLPDRTKRARPTPYPTQEKHHTSGTHSVAESPFGLKKTAALSRLHLDIAQNAARSQPAEIQFRAAHNEQSGMMGYSNATSTVAMQAPDFESSTLLPEPMEEEDPFSDGEGHTDPTTQRQIADRSPGVMFERLVRRNMPMTDMPRGCRIDSTGQVHRLSSGSSSGESISQAKRHRGDGYAIASTPQVHTVSLKTPGGMSTILRDDSIPRRCPPLTREEVITHIMYGRTADGFAIDHRGMEMACYENIGNVEIGFKIVRYVNDKGEPIQRYQDDDWVREEIYPILQIGPTRRPKATKTHGYPPQMQHYIRADMVQEHSTGDNIMIENGQGYIPQRQRPDLNFISTGSSTSSDGIFMPRPMPKLRGRYVIPKEDTPERMLVTLRASLDKLTADSERRTRQEEASNRTENRVDVAAVTLARDDAMKSVQLSNKIIKSLELEKDELLQVIQSKPDRTEVRQDINKGISKLDGETKSNMLGQLKSMHAEQAREIKDLGEYVKEEMRNRKEQVDILIERQTDLFKECKRQMNAIKGDVSDGLGAVQIMLESVQLEMKNGDFTNMTPMPQMITTIQPLPVHSNISVQDLQACSSSGTILSPIEENPATDNSPASQSPQEIRPMVESDNDENPFPVQGVDMDFTSSLGTPGDNEEGHTAPQHMQLMMMEAMFRQQQHFLSIEATKDYSADGDRKISLPAPFNDPRHGKEQRTAEDFARSVKLVMKAKQFSEGVARQELNKCLGSEIQDYVRGFDASGTATVAHVLEQIIKRYNTTEVRDSHREEFSRMKQEGMTLTSYMDKLRNIRAKGWQTPLHESALQQEDALNRHFLKTLKSTKLMTLLDTHYTAHNEGFDDLASEKVLTMAVRLDGTLDRNEGTSQRKRPDCNLCFKDGHTVVDCPNRHNVPKKRIYLVEQDHKNAPHPEIFEIRNQGQTATMTHDPMMIGEIIALMSQLETMEVKKNEGMVWCTSCAVPGHLNENCMNPHLQGKENYLPIKLRGRKVLNEVRTILEDTELLIELLKEFLLKKPQINLYCKANCTVCDSKGHEAGPQCQRVIDTLDQQQSKAKEMRRQANNVQARQSSDQYRQNQPNNYNRNGNNQNQGFFRNSNNQGLNGNRQRNEQAKAVYQESPPEDRDGGDQGNE